MAISRVSPYLTPVQYATVLGIIRDIRQEDTRALALTAFAEHTPDAVTVPSEYFAVASTFTNLAWWARVHCAALPLLRDGQQRQTLIDFLLAQLRQLTGKDITMGIAGLWDGLIPYLSSAGLQTALDVAATSEDTWARDYLISRLAPRLDETQAIAVVSAIETPLWKARAFIALAERGGSPRGRSELLAAVAQLGADAELMPIAALLPDEQRLAVLNAAALNLMSGTFIGDPPPMLADHLLKAPPARLRSLWQETTPTLIGQGRGKVFKRMADLDLFLRRVAGDRVALDIATAIPGRRSLVALIRPVLYLQLVPMLHGTCTRKETSAERHREPGLACRRLMLGQRGKQRRRPCRGAGHRTAGREVQCNQRTLQPTCRLCKSGHRRG